MPTFTLNFTRPGNQIVGQYYNFLRLGRSGYTRVDADPARHRQTLAVRIGEMGPFYVVSDGRAIPVVSFTVRDDVPYTAFDVSHRLRYHGWQVPAYTMPDDATDVVVLRIVVREGFTRDLSEMLLDHLAEATAALQEDPPLKSATRTGFAH